MCLLLLSLFFFLPSSKVLAFLCLSVSLCEDFFSPFSCFLFLPVFSRFSGDSANCRDVVLRADIMTQLIRLCQGSPRISLLRNATWTLSNLCRGKPQPAFNLVSPIIWFSLCMFLSWSPRCCFTDLSRPSCSCQFIVQPWWRSFDWCMLGTFLSVWWFGAEQWKDFCFTATQHCPPSCWSPRVRSLVDSSVCLSLIRVVVHFGFLCSFHSSWSLFSSSLCSAILPVQFALQLFDRLAISSQGMMHRLKWLFRQALFLGS